MIGNDYLVAVDIGTSKIAVLVAAEAKEGNFKKVALVKVPNEGMKAGTIEDVNAVARCLTSAIQEAEKLSNLTIKKAFVNITHRDIQSYNKNDKVPKSPEMSAVTENDLAAATQVASKIEDKDGNSEVLHVFPRNYELDEDHNVRNPLGMHTSELRIESHVVTIPSDARKALQTVMNKAGVQIDRMVVNHIAASELTLTTDEKEVGTILLDIGSGVTDIAVYSDGVITYTATVPVGGFLFSNDVSMAFSIPFKEAEEIKITKGSCVTERRRGSEPLNIKPHNLDESVDITAKDVARILKDRVQELFQLVQHQLSQPALEGMNIKNVILTGGGAKLSGLDTLAKFVLNRNIKLVPPRLIPGIEPEEGSLSEAVVLGLLNWGARAGASSGHAVERPASSSGGASSTPTRPVKRGRLSSIFSKLRGN